MAGGEVCKQKFTRIGDIAAFTIPTLDIPSVPQECCVLLPALASTLDAEFKDDFFEVLFHYDRLLTASVVLKLQEQIAGVFVDIATLTDNTYGINRPFDFQRFKDDSRSFVGYRLDWKTVLSVEGEGIFRIESTHTDLFTIETVEVSFEFCLKEYSATRANETTRFTWFLDGLIGDVLDDEQVVDYRNLATLIGGDGWINQLRLPKSFFGRNKSNYEKEFVRYSNGQQVWIKDEQIEVYEWATGRYDGILHGYIKSNILQGDRILVTDYNRLNSNKIVNKAVKFDGNYEPDYTVNSLLSRAIVPFSQEFQNRKKLRC